MADYTNCSICSSRVRCSFFAAHLIDKHPQEMKKLNIGKMKNSLQSKTPFISMSDKVGVGGNTFYTCFGCKKGWIRKGLAEQHPFSCREKHLAALKEIIDDTPQDTTVVDDTSAAIQKENIRLQKELKNTKIQLECVEEDLESANKDTTILLILQKEYPNIYSRIEELQELTVEEVDDIYRKCR